MINQLLINVISDVPESSKPLTGWPSTQASTTAGSKYLGVVFPTWVFPNSKAIFLTIFYCLKPGIFSTTKPRYFEKPGIDVAFKYY